VFVMSYLVRVKHFFIDSKSRLGFEFHQRPEFKLKLQNTKPAKWDQMLGIWHIPYYDNHLSYLEKQWGDLAIFHNVDQNKQTQLRSKIMPTPVPDAFMQQMRLKRYSQNTQKTYASVVSKFLSYWKNIQPEQITELQVRDYMIYLVVIGNEESL
jgi:integrase/recombinase XerD